MERKISARLLDQRLRNRVMEAISRLADGPDEWGAGEYFNQFYDQMGPEDAPWPNSAMSDDEALALNDLCNFLNEACSATPKKLSEDALRAGGWLSRIQPKAQLALETFLLRGRFDEEVEKAEPSFDNGQSWYVLARSSH